MPLLALFAAFLTYCVGLAVFEAYREKRWTPRYRLAGLVACAVLVAAVVGLIALDVDSVEDGAVQSTQHRTSSGEEEVTHGDHDAGLCDQPADRSNAGRSECIGRHCQSKGPQPPFLALPPDWWAARWDRSMRRCCRAADRSPVWT